jgi:exosortase E/protease (VPEID-CTERM system)
MFALLRGQRLNADLARIPLPSPKRYIIPVALCHLAIFAIFVWMTGIVLAPAAQSRPFAGLAFVSWVSLALLVLASLIACLFPISSWLILARDSWLPAVGALSVGIIAVIAATLSSKLYAPLARATLYCCYALLSVFEPNLVFRPDKFVIGTGSFMVEVAEPCSGYEGVGLVLAFSGFYLFVFRRQFRFPRALLLPLVGAAVIWLVNLARIAALIEIGARISPAIAVGGFHSQAGWLGFITVSLGIVFLANRLPFFLKNPTSPTGALAHAGPSPELVYLGPLIAIVAASMLTGAFSAGGPDELYPFRLAAVAVPLWYFRRDYRAMRWSFSGYAVGIGLVVYAIWIARSLLAANPTSATSVPSLGALGPVSFSWVISRVIGSVITVPIAEELAFRGFLSRRLQSAEFENVPPTHSTWFALFVSSVAFGALHHHWIEGVAAGMLYAHAYHRRGSIGDAVLAHATTNAVLSVQAAMLGDWSIIS